MKAWSVSMCFCLAVAIHQASAISGVSSGPTVLKVGRKEMKLDLPGTVAKAQVQASVPRTPKTFRSPLGWNSWNHFQCNITEDIVKTAADRLVSSGLAALGYVYVNIDDCWQADSRDSQGRLVASPVSFPSGIKALADYVHSKGLKLGLYSDSGKRTCSGKPGSLGHEAIDALTFAEWGVDYVKYDSCYDDGTTTKRGQSAMRNALDAAGRDISVSMCEGGQDSSALWAYGLADPWRTTLGTDDTWRSVTWVSDTSNKWAKYADPRNWNDLDILQVAKGGMGETEHHVHFNLWAIMKAPLLAACALSAESQPAMTILSTNEAVSLNQDSLGVQAQEVQLSKASPVKVWVGSLSEGRKVVALVNRGGTSENVSVSWRKLGLNPEQQMHARDLWKESAIDSADSEDLTAQVASHGVRLFVLWPATDSNLKQ
ncbi:unnamed protein product [Closterium sp. Yama58-4]|nr:unnamed protein product [Closterium sp. Yama58-4]